MIEPLGNQFFRGTRALPFREAVRVGEVVYLSGQLAFDTHGELVGDDITTQTRACIANITDVLHRCGLSLTDVFKVTAWLVDAADFPDFNTAFAAAFGEHLPVRSTVVSGLLAPGARVELEVMAYAGAS